MMNRLRMVGIGAMVLAVAGCGDATTPQCENVSLSAQAMMTGATTAAGQVAGSIDGSMAFEITQRQENADGTESLQTRHTFTAGDHVLRTTDNVTLGVMTEAQTRPITGTLTVTGESAGRWAGASGTLTADGTVDYTGQPAPTLAGTYTGEICW